MPPARRSAKRSGKKSARRSAKRSGKKSARRSARRSPKKSARRSAKRSGKKKSPKKSPRRANHTPYYGRFNNFLNDVFGYGVHEDTGEEGAARRSLESEIEIYVLRYEKEERLSALLDFFESKRYHFRITDFVPDADGKRKADSYDPKPVNFYALRDLMDRMYASDLVSTIDTVDKQIDSYLAYTKEVRAKTEELAKTLRTPQQISDERYKLNRQIEAFYSDSYARCLLEKKIYDEKVKLLPPGDKEKMDNLLKGYRDLPIRPEAVRFSYEDEIRKSGNRDQLYEFQQLNEKISYLPYQKREEVKEMEKKVQEERAAATADINAKGEKLYKEENAYSEAVKKVEADAILLTGYRPSATTESYVNAENPSEPTIKRTMLQILKKGLVKPPKEQGLLSEPVSLAYKIAEANAAAGAEMRRYQAASDARKRADVAAAERKQGMYNAYVQAFGTGNDRTDAALHRLRNRGINV